MYKQKYFNAEFGVEQQILDAYKVYLDMIDSEPGTIHTPEHRKWERKFNKLYNKFKAQVQWHNYADSEITKIEWYCAEYLTNKTLKVK